MQVIQVLLIVLFLRVGGLKLEILRQNDIIQYLVEACVNAEALDVEQAPEE